MRGTVALTDYGWYEFLAARKPHEVNFWTPSPRRRFNADPFSPFFFKLKSPHNAICGFAHFFEWTTLPDWLAWQCFGEGNGCRSFDEMRERIHRLRQGIRYEPTGPLDEIGCILLLHPVFFPPEDWVKQPSDWKVRIQVSKQYDLDTGEGARIWQECQARRSESPVIAHVSEIPEVERREPPYGAPHLAVSRLGQGTFRVAVTEAYERACAVTGEHSLPALDAAHIKPFAQSGPHDVRNGLLLRADLHRLFDSGYVTVTPELRLEVSSRLRQDYQNGRSYYPLHGTSVRTPRTVSQFPSSELLRWHNDHVFLG